MESISWLTLIISLFVLRWIRWIYKLDTSCYQMNHLNAISVKCILCIGLQPCLCLCLHFAVKYDKIHCFWQGIWIADKNTCEQKALSNLTTSASQPNVYVSLSTWGANIYSLMAKTHSNKYVFELKQKKAIASQTKTFTWVKCAEKTAEFQLVFLAHALSQFLLSNVKWYGCILTETGCRGVQNTESHSALVCLSTLSNLPVRSVA